MSVSFQILKDFGLVYVRYEGEARVADTMQAFGAYAQHPDCRPGLKQLVDLTRLTGIERNYAKIMEMQARKAEIFMSGDSETLMVYLATNEIAREMSQMILRSWEPFPSVVPIVLDDETAALEILGLPQKNLSELLAAA